MGEFDANKIKKLRELNHITQKQLGNLLGISDRAVSKWESGLSKPSGKNLISLAKIFHVQIETFFKNANHIKTKKAEEGGHYSAFVSSGLVGHEGGELLVANKLEEINKLF